MPEMTPPEPSRELLKRVHSRIVSDLRPSFFTICWKSGAAVTLGGFLSLSLCGQFGIGLTHASMHLNHHLHEHTQNLSSALLCGFFFAFLPPLILRLFCSSVQFRVITRRSPQAAIVWFFGLGVFLAHHGETGAQILFFAIWCGATAITFFAVSWLIDRVTSRSELALR